MSTITCVEDFSKIYKRRVPKMFYDFVEAGSYTESTLHNNEVDLQKILIRQRVGVDVSDIDSSASVVSEAARLPVAFAPIGMLGMQRAGGEIKVARAAKAFGVPFILSTMSTGISFGPERSAHRVYCWGERWCMRSERPDSKA